MNDDWKNPHWEEKYKTPLNKQIYRWTGKCPWWTWKQWIFMGLAFSWKVWLFLCIIAWLVSCTTLKPHGERANICTLEPYWNQETIDRIKNKKDCCRYQCVPAPSYLEWNKCVGDCSSTTIESKTKPYTEKAWVRPRPYAYP